LCEAFFERVFVEGASERFKKHYAHLDLDDIVMNYSDLMVQRMGGMDFYASRQGMASLLRRHQDLNVEQEDAEEWLRLMNAAMDEMENEKMPTKNPLIEGKPKMTPVPRKMIMNYFRFIAYYLVAAEETRRSMVDMMGADLEIVRKVKGCPHLTAKVEMEEKRVADAAAAVREAEEKAAAEAAEAARVEAEIKRKAELDAALATAFAGSGDADDDDDDDMNLDMGWGDDVPVLE